jgi:hypothetical protein
MYERSKRAVDWFSQMHPWRRGTSDMLMSGTIILFSFAGNLTHKEKNYYEPIPINQKT